MTVETLLKPENKDTLVKVLTYHVVAGTIDAASIQKAIQAGGGKASLETVTGGMLTAKMSGRALPIAGKKGGMSTMSIAMESKGVIRVVETVVLPN